MRQGYVNSIWKLLNLLHSILGLRCQFTPTLLNQATTEEFWRARSNAQKGTEFLSQIQVLFHIFERLSFGCTSKPNC